ncbi:MULTISPECIES: Crp/Fnr family transcriptional regulator [Sphingobacterium]|uniref:Crp/Fnr family transcriptional regulator n=1 Tax=Sphingobacterium TaxID=28453 RepID=UPI000627C7CD|nr:Crp/Fnr family transcriptional regulator [Sphingobacterium sp. Ag1]KKO89087.1 hypothetical protein AAW12_23330 [Sphingobacterium sp. Ag1]
MINLLIENIVKYVELEPEEKRKIAAVVSLKKVKRREMLLQVGEVQKSIIFVVKGCLRSYALDHKGFEHVLQFAPNNFWIGDLTSLKLKHPSILYIDAIFESEILVISHTDFEALYHAVPKLERCFRILYERSIAASQRRIVERQTLPAFERYLCFLNRFPDLCHILPKRMIASYIGVTPEFFSRLVHLSFKHKKE